MVGNSAGLNWLRGLVGGLAGGALGYFAFFLLARQGIYAMVLPGALLGLGCGFLSGIESNVLGIVCGLLAVMLGCFTEWQFAPFAADGRLAYFIQNVHNLSTATLIMISVGGLCGYWFGKGRENGAGHSE